MREVNKIHPIAITPQPSWLEIAQSLIPTLQPTYQAPIAVVAAVRNTSSFLRWTMVPAMSLETFYATSFTEGQQFILDFGGHRTGFLSFYLNGAGFAADAPAWLRLTFGEVPGDVAEPFLPYNGSLTSSWLPWETIHVDYLPEQVNMTRRYAFRYVKVEILATSGTYGAQFLNITATGVTSGTSTPPPPPSSLSPLLKTIDSIGIATLKDCMQTSFEDGPKRDRRLWLGDLRVMALSNHVTFQNYNLVKRCLYLFASFPLPNGLLPPCVYEKPYPHSYETLILDYSAVYVVVLYEYVNMTGDVAVAKDLWPVAKTQIDQLATFINKDGLFNNADNDGFIDWNNDLNKNASMQGVVLWALRRAILLGGLVGADVSNYTTLAASMTQAAITNYYDINDGLFVSSGQISWASQAWMILAEVVDAKSGSLIFQNLAKQTNVVLPSSPYLYHYVLESMYQINYLQGASQVLEEYWGGMVSDGANTFWEVYEPGDASFSPYGDLHVTSYCHGWSSGASYFLRTFGNQ